MIKNELNEIKVKKKLKYTIYIYIYIYYQLENKLIMKLMY